VDAQTKSIEALHQQLAELEQQRADLERTLAERHNAAKGDIATQVKDLILSNGYSLEEILPLVTNSGRRRRQTSEHRTGYYVDPADPTNTYVRGPIPGWMKDKMAELGLSPASKADRNAFKANHLQRVG
jgi:DNA-binding protein H-NS